MICKKEIDPLSQGAALATLPRKKSCSNLYNKEKDTKTQSREDVYLRDWDEIVGTIEEVENTEIDTTIAHITCIYQKTISVVLPKDTPEHQIKQLKNLTGKTIAILKTDNPNESIKIRPVTETKSDPSEPNKNDKTEPTGTQYVYTQNLWVRFCR